jgi:hypothetical protein
MVGWWRGFIFSNSTARIWILGIVRFQMRLRSRIRRNDRRDLSASEGGGYLLRSMIKPRFSTC